MLVIPTKLVNGISSPQYDLVSHYVFSVLASSRGFVQPRCSPQQLILFFFLIFNFFGYKKQCGSQFSTSRLIMFVHIHPTAKTLKKKKKKEHRVPDNHSRRSKKGKLQTLGWCYTHPGVCQQTRIPKTIPRQFSHNGQFLAIHRKKKFKNRVQRGTGSKCCTYILNKKRKKKEC